MISVQDWKTAKSAIAYDTDHAEAVEALAALLEGDITPTDAAESITRAYTASVKVIQGPPKEAPWDINKLAEFWRVFVANAIRSFGTAEQHERLFELLMEISRQPDLEDDDGMVVVTSDRKTYWVDLPDFDGCFAHAGLHYEPAREFSPADRELFLSQKQQFLNGTRFAAMLLSEKKFASGLPWFTSYFLKIGLEHSYDERFEDTTRVSRDEWETLIPAATTWLLIAGRTIYEHCQEDDLYDGWEKGTWNLQRWNLWKQQLGTFGEGEDFNDECRGLALQTVKKMAAVEAEYKAGPPPLATWWPIDALEDELRSSTFPVQ